MNDKTPIYLDDEDAKLFLAFQKHRGLVDRLNDVGFFHQTDCKIEILLDSTGRVGDIYVHTRHRGGIERVYLSNKKIKEKQINKSLRRN